VKLTREQLHRILSTATKHEISKNAFSCEIVFTVKFDELRLRDAMLGTGVRDVNLMQEILDAIKPEKYEPGWKDPRQQSTEDLYADWMKARYETSEEKFRRAYEEAMRFDQKNQYNWSRGTSSDGNRSAPEWAKTLGVSASATVDEIKQAHRKLASKHHPDKGGSNEMMQKINKARDEALAGVS